MKSRIKWLFLPGIMAVLSVFFTTPYASGQG